MPASSVMQSAFPKHRKERRKKERKKKEREQERKKEREKEVRTSKDPSSARNLRLRRLSGSLGATSVEAELSGRVANAHGRVRQKKSAATERG